jgi:hypothetical protein
MIKSVDLVPGLKCVVKHGKKSQGHKDYDWSKVDQCLHGFPSGRSAFGVWQSMGQMCDMVYLTDGTEYEVVVKPKRLPQTSSKFVTIKLSTGEVCFTWLLSAMHDAEIIPKSGDQNE